MSVAFSFVKYQGTGNDFILIDGRNRDYSFLNADAISKICHRRFGIGADGLIILKERPGYDFDMDFYNSDGNPGSMCGNGGRCIVAFAHDLQIIRDDTHFWAPDGEHKATYFDQHKISLLMSDVDTIEEHENGLFMNTGSPHLVIFKDTKSHEEVYRLGKEIRYSNAYAPKGTNVNFVRNKQNYIEVITYERGVEDITLSCGTGTVAAVLSSNYLFNLPSPVKAITPGGELMVMFEKATKGKYNHINLIGPAIKVFEGTFEL